MALDVNKIRDGGDSEADLRQRAIDISTAIHRTNTDLRGRLLRYVAEDLQLHAQGCTGNMIMSVARAYGEPKEGA